MRFSEQAGEDAVSIGLTCVNAWLYNHNVVLPDSLLGDGKRGPEQGDRTLIIPRPISH